MNDHCLHTPHYCLSLAAAELVEESSCPSSAILGYLGRVILGYLSRMLLPLPCFALFMNGLLT